MGFWIAPPVCPPARGLCTPCLCASQANSDDDDDDDDDDGGVAGKKGGAGGAGEYPGPDDIDVLDDARLWTKLAGDVMAETGLSPPRLIRTEDQDRSALLPLGPEADEAGPLSPGGVGVGGVTSPSLAGSASAPALRSGSPSAALKPVVRSPLPPRVAVAGTCASCDGVWVRFGAGFVAVEVAGVEDCCLCVCGGPGCFSVSGVPQTKTACLFPCVFHRAGVGADSEPAVKPRVTGGKLVAGSPKLSPLARK